MKKAYLKWIIPVIVLSLEKKELWLRIIVWAVTLYAFIFVKVMTVIRITASFQHYVDYCIAFLLYAGVLLSIVKSVKARN